MENEVRNCTECGPIVAEKYQKEIGLLRQVYEEARAILRYAGVDEKRFMTALDNLDAAIEKVKLLDSGLDECG